MPTARDGAVAVVDKNIIYVAGGYNGSTFIATVESYNPATNTWKEEAPMLESKDLPVAGLIGSTIIVADGANAPGEITGDTEGFDATKNTWTTRATDPTARTGACGAVISSRLYDAGGYINNDGAATTVNESFSLSKNQWTTTLAPMPQGTLFPGSAVHNGQLYCFGGESTWAGNPSTTCRFTSRRFAVLNHGGMLAVPSYGGPLTLNSDCQVTAEVLAGLRETDRGCNRA